MPAAADLLTDLAVALDELELRWYVFGAQAVAFHGRPRLTEDVDVTVELGAVDVDTLVARLERAGFELSAIADDEFVRATRVLPFEHAATGMALDMVLAGPGLEELFLAEARRHDLGGIAVPVLSPEHLVVTKVLAGRPKDLDDAAEMINHVDLDLAAIRALLVQLEEALGQSDLLPLLERLVAGVLP